MVEIAMKYGMLAKEVKALKMKIQRLGVDQSVTAVIHLVSYIQFSIKAIMSSSQQ